MRQMRQPPFQVFLCVWFNNLENIHPFVFLILKYYSALAWFFFFSIFELCILASKFVICGCPVNINFWPNLCCSSASFDFLSHRKISRWTATSEFEKVSDTSFLICSVKSTIQYLNINQIKSYQPLLISPSWILEGVSWIHSHLSPFFHEVPLFVLVSSRL